MELPRASHGESTLRTLPIGAGLHEGRRQLIDAVEIAVDPFEAAAGDVGMDWRPALLQLVP